MIACNALLAGFGLGIGGMGTISSLVKNLIVALPPSSQPSAITR